MATNSYEPSLARLLAHEGGYTNHPSDPGGPTNFGITIADYRKYAKPGATAADVKAMQLSEAKAIYRAKYWDAQRCDDLPAGVDDSIFDYGVNSGIGRSGKVLRRVLGLADNTSALTDGVIAAAQAADAGKLVAAICDERLRFLQSLKTWSVFGKGWGRRVAEVKAFSLQLVAAEAVRRANVTPVSPSQPKPSSDVQGAGKGVVPAAKPVEPKQVAVAGSLLAGLIAGLRAHTVEIAVGGVVIAILVAVLIHIIWKKKG